MQFWETEYCFLVLENSEVFVVTNHVLFTLFVTLFTTLKPSNFLLLNQNMSRSGNLDLEMKESHRLLAITHREELSVLI